MMSDSAPNMKRALRVHVGSMGLARGVKDPEPDLPASDGDFSAEAALYANDARIADGVVDSKSTNVLVVDGMRNISKVAERIVGAVAVDVVDLMRRPCARDMEPRQSMRWIPMAAHSNLDVSVSLDAAGNHPNGNAAASGDAPPEYSGACLVVEKLAEMLRRKIAHSHEALRVADWREACAVLEAPFRLRHYRCAWAGAKRRAVTCRYIFREG